MPYVEATRQTAQARISKALDVLKMRGVHDDRCPRCRTSNWNVDLLHIPASSEMSAPNTVGQLFPQSMAFSQNSGVLPLLGIVCTNCGYSIFHNLNVLGV